MVQDIILALRLVFAWYSVISSGDYEGDISLWTDRVLEIRIARQPRYHRRGGGDAGGLRSDVSHVITRSVVTLTHEGPRGASLPMIMVQAASLEVLLLMVTDLTLIRWGYKNKIQFPSSDEIRASNKLLCSDWPARFQGLALIGWAVWCTLTRISIKLQRCSSQHHITSRCHYPVNTNLCTIDPLHEGPRLVAGPHRGLEEPIHVDVIHLNNPWRAVRGIPSKQG